MAKLLGRMLILTSIFVVSSLIFMIQWTMDIYKVPFDKDSCRILERMNSTNPEFKIVYALGEMDVENYTRLIGEGRDSLLQRQPGGKPFQEPSFTTVTSCKLYLDQIFNKEVPDPSGNHTKTEQTKTIREKREDATKPFQLGDKKWLMKERYYNWTVSNEICQFAWYQDVKFREYCPQHTNLTTGLVPIHPSALMSDSNTLKFYRARRNTDFYVSLHTEAIVDGDNGYVYSDGYCYMPRQCPAPRATTLDFLMQLPRYGEVFVLTQTRGQQYFHWTIEDLPRISFHLPFLLKHKQVKIHVPSISADVITLMSIFGLEAERLVFGSIQASLVYLPMGGGCGTQIHYTSVTLMSNIFLNHLALVSLPIVEVRNLIVLIQRSKKRTLQQHSEIANMLEVEATKFDLQLRVFNDTPVPSIQETMSMFNRAVLVVAPHGAGLANLIFSKVGTAVIEIMCEGNPNTCFQKLSYSLGMKYHGLKAKGCAQMVADLSYVQNVVHLFLKNVHADKQALRVR